MSVAAGKVMKLSKMGVLILTSASTQVSVQTILFVRILLETTLVSVMLAFKGTFARTLMNVPSSTVVLQILNARIVMEVSTAVVSQDSRPMVKSVNVYLVSKETTVLQILMNVKIIQTSATRTHHA